MLDDKLETFRMVAYLNSYTKAAKKLFISQPAVSQQIKQLEEELGVKLFIYEKRKLRITDAGKELLQFVETIKVQTKKMKIKLKMENKEETPLNFATTFSLSDNYAWKIIEYYKKINTKKISCLTLNTYQCLEALRYGKIDFAVVEGNFERKNYETCVIKDEPFIVTGSKNLGLVDKEYDVRELLKYPIIYREKGSGSLEITKQILGMWNVNFKDFKCEYQIGSLRLYKKMILNDIGIGFCYKCLFTKELEQEQIKEIKIKNLATSHPIFLVWLKGNVQIKEEIEKLRELLK